MNIVSLVDVDAGQGDQHLDDFGATIVACCPQRSPTNLASLVDVSAGQGDQHLDDIGVTLDACCEETGRVFE